jgi:hypothetical protein
VLVGDKGRDQVRFSSRNLNITFMGLLHSDRQPPLSSFTSESLRETICAMVL